MESGAGAGVGEVKNVDMWKVGQLEGCRGEW